MEGELYYRHTPKGEWTKFTGSQYRLRVLELERQVKSVGLADVGGLLPDDFDEWIAKVENECVIDMDLPHIIWHDFFKPRGIFPKHAKRDKQ